MKELYNKIKLLNIESVYNYVMENNKSFNLPYHNNFHLENVTLFTIRGCEANDIPNPNVRLAAVAALFHDMNHTGSGKNDDVNILESVKAFLDFNSSFELFEDEEQETIISLIKATRYPYLKECVDLSILQKIIRDSDVLQGPFCQNYINGVVFGIARENNIPLKSMLDGQVKFLSSMVFCTEWANKLYQEVLQETIEKVDSAKLLFN